MQKPTLESFLTFVFESNPHLLLDHEEFDGCAVGMFTRELNASEFPEEAASPSVLHDRLEDDALKQLHMGGPGSLVSFEVSNGRYTEYFDSLMLTDAINEIPVMLKYCPTMGDLQQFIRDYYPTYVPGYGT